MTIACLKLTMGAIERFMAYRPPPCIHIYIGVVASRFTSSPFTSSSSLLILQTLHNPFVFLSPLQLLSTSSTSFFYCSWSTPQHFLNPIRPSAWLQWHLPDPPSPVPPLARMAVPFVPWSLASTSVSNASFAKSTWAQELRSHATSSHTKRGPKSFHHSPTGAAGTTTSPYTHQADKKFSI